MRRTTLALASLALCINLAQAHEEDEGDFEQAIEYRTGVMNVMLWNLKHMGAVIKGKAKYDRAGFTRQARDLNATAHLDILAGFPEDSDEGEDTDAKGEIWLDWDNFTAKLDSLRKETGALANTAAGGDFAAIKTQFGKVGKACKSCHKAFRE
ncbi:c-type cytochrome [Thiolapillus brandeum]|uniref:Cytochrome c, class II n=1 Tax=Thiolapillus brandeum TaxID=1076588 RepID=A0A7U6JGN1_9GAMM|nr:cytochrome c [Thiolapillus brandeum]BAO42983.1 cytochrome c, class II [Thiolapillus brandeum]